MYLFTWPGCRRLTVSLPPSLPPSLPHTHTHTDTHTDTHNNKRHRAESVQSSSEQLNIVSRCLSPAASANHSSGQKHSESSFKFRYLFPKTFYIVTQDTSFIIFILIFLLFHIQSRKSSEQLAFLKTFLHSLINSFMYLFWPFQYSHNNLLSIHINTQHTHNKAHN